MNNIAARGYFQEQLLHIENTPPTCQHPSGETRNPKPNVDFNNVLTVAHNTKHKKLIRHRKDDHLTSRIYTSRTIGRRR